MNRWKDFLDSLASRGGTILILLLLVAFFALAVIHVMHAGEKGEIATVLISTFSSITGALTVALTGQRMANGNSNGKVPPPAAPQKGKDDAFPSVE